MACQNLFLIIDSAERRKGGEKRKGKWGRDRRARIHNWGALNLTSLRKLERRKQKYFFPKIRKQTSRWSYIRPASVKDFFNLILCWSSGGRKKLFEGRTMTRVKQGWQQELLRQQKKGRSIALGTQLTRKRLKDSSSISNHESNGRLKHCGRGQAQPFSPPSIRARWCSSSPLPPPQACLTFQVKYSPPHPTAVHRLSPCLGRFQHFFQRYQPA